MPHYKNGKPANEGDLVIIANPQAVPVTLGVLVQITPGTETCNGQIIPIARQYKDGAWRQVQALYNECLTIKELLPLVADSMPKASEEEASAQPVGSGG